MANKVSESAALVENKFWALTQSCVNSVIEKQKKDLKPRRALQNCLALGNSPLSLPFGGLEHNIWRKSGLHLWETAHLISVSPG